MSPELSIVIPSHCRPDLLQTCLCSVVRFAPAGTEIVVVDDGSPDGSASAVAAQFKGVRAIRRRRGGFCAAANTGIRATGAPLVELLNDDTEVTSGWAEAATACFRDPRVGAVAPLVLRRSERHGLLVDSAGDRYYLGGIAGKRGFGETLGPRYLRRQRVFGASASSAFYRREALARTGGFCEAFGAYFEDIDLAFRLHRVGYDVVFEPAARVLHCGSSSYRTAGRRLLAQQSRNEELVFWRNIPASALSKALPRHTGVLLAKAWRRWEEGRFAAFLWGRLRVLVDAAGVFRHRRRLRDLDAGLAFEEWGVDSNYWHPGSTRPSGP